MSNHTGSDDRGEADDQTSDAPSDADAEAEKAEPSSEEADPEGARSPEDVPADGEDARAYLKGLVQSLIFVCDSPMTLKEVARAAKIDRKRTAELIEELRSDHAGQGIVLHEVSGSWPAPCCVCPKGRFRVPFQGKWWA
jgi:hypothetical protein